MSCLADNAERGCVEGSSNGTGSTEPEVIALSAIDPATIDPAARDTGLADIEYVDGFGSSPTNLRRTESERTLLGDR